MAIGVPRFLLGRHLTVTVTPQDVSSGGVFSNNALGTLTFKASIEEDSFESTLSTQNLASLGSFNANPVPIEYDAVYSLTELMAALPLVASSSYAWGYGNYLEKIAATSWYHYITVTAADTSGSAVRTWSFYALLTGLKRSSPKAKNTNVATFRLVSVGNGSGGYASNPVLGP